MFNQALTVLEVENGCTICEISEVPWKKVNEASEREDEIDYETKEMKHSGMNTVNTHMHTHTHTR